MIVCACAPHLGLTAAVLASGLPEPDGPAAVAPSEASGREIGDVNVIARELGLRAGVDVGTALETFPSLVLLPPDPAGMDAAWEVVLESLEEIGAEVEAERAGEAFFDPGPLVAMYGGLTGVLRETFQAVDGRALIGAGPTRLAALTTLAPAAELLNVVTPGGLEQHLDGLPVELLRERVPAAGGTGMHETLERLGIETLGRMRRLPPDAMSDRFGMAGLEALRIARGVEGPLRPRRSRAGIEVSLDLEEPGGGGRLTSAIELACGSIASRLETAGLLARSFELGFRLEDGGSLSERLLPRVPTRSATTISLLAHGAFDRLPSLVESITLRVPEATGEGLPQADLFTDPSSGRREKIREAVRQVEAAVGDQALLRIVETDPESRLPERRVLMVPLSECGT